MIVRDKKFLEQIRKLPCIACGRWPNDYTGTEAHHVKTRGAGGDDSPHNVLPLCTHCHTSSRFAWHAGKFTFLRRHPHVVDHLRHLGWYICLKTNSMYYPDGDTHG